MIVCQFAGLLKSIRGFYRTTIGDWIRCISGAGKEYNVVDGSLQTRLKYFKLLAKFIHVGNIMCRQNIRLFILAAETVIIRYVFQHIYHFSRLLCHRSNYIINFSKFIQFSTNLNALHTCNTEILMCHKALTSNSSSRPFSTHKLIIINNSDQSGRASPTWSFQYCGVYTIKSTHSHLNLL